MFPVMDDKHPALRWAAWEQLTPRARAVIDDAAERIYAELAAIADWGPTNCGEACERWKRAFAAAGVPVAVIEGNYDPGWDPNITSPASTEHVWLRVDGFLFDPTAFQFGADIDPGAYHPLGEDAS